MKVRAITWFIGFNTMAFLIGLMVQSAAADNHHKGAGHHGHHKAYHGGILNVIGTCETGHVEVRLEGNRLEAWLVGGGHDTDRAVPVKTKEIPLSVNLPDQRNRNLVLKAAPMRLAGEKVGHCSHFLGEADWLNHVEAFEARGELQFKGVLHKLVIKYPEGYDPAHGHRK